MNCNASVYIFGLVNYGQIKDVFLSNNGITSFFFELAGFEFKIKKIGLLINTYGMHIDVLTHFLAYRTELVSFFVRYATKFGW
jgi:hypothetical protein